MKINLYDYEVEIEDNILTEVDIYNKYVELSDEAVEEFLKFYRNASGIGEVISQGKNVAYDQYRKIVRHTISLCACNGVFGLTEDDVFKCHSTFAVNNVLNEIASKADSIKLQQRKEEAYRERRKAYRGRFVGGGFGIEGAVKGMAMAGAANMVSGMFHSVANAFGNVGSAIKKNSRLNHLYHDGVSADICKAIHKDCINFYYVMEEILDSNGFRSYNIPRRIKEADAIYKQLEDGILPKETYPQAIATMISTFPGKIEYYALACNLLGGSNGELKRLVAKFNLDVDEYSLIEASAEWRNLIFGDFLDYIKNDESYKFMYLKRLRYSKWGREIIEELQYGPVDAVAQIIANYIEEFREDKKYRELDMYTFENGKNAYLLALFECRGVKLGYKEVPIFAINISNQIMKGADTSEHILLTSNKIYYVSKEGKNNKSINVQEIKNIEFNDDEYGVQINNFWFAPKTCLSSEDELDLRGLLSSIIAIIQCLMSVGHSVRSAAIIRQDSLEKDYEKPNDICIYFREPFYDLIENGGEIKRVIELMNTESDNGYELRNSTTIMPEESNEIKLVAHKNHKFESLLTDKKLYIDTTQEKSTIAYDLQDIESAYYEWKYMSEAFWINGKQYPAISSNVKEQAKEFIGVVYWLRKYTNDKKSTSAVGSQNDVMFTTSSVDEFKRQYSSYMELIETGNIHKLWECVKKGEPIAEYVIWQTYEKILPPMKLGYLEADILNSICTDIESNTGKDSSISKFVKSVLYVKLNIENENAVGEVKRQLAVIEALARENNCVSAMAYAGFRMTSANTLDEREGLDFLIKSANKNHPLAMAWYGSYLMSGEHRVKVDVNTARLMIGAAAYAGQGYAIKLCQKYNISYEQYSDKGNGSKEICFNKYNNNWKLERFPNVLDFKYSVYFAVYHKDVIYNNGHFLENDESLSCVMESLCVPADEKLYMATSFQMMGHFKKNFSGFAIGQSGIYIRESKKNCIHYSWDDFILTKINSDNALEIDRVRLYSSGGFVWMCSELLNELQKITMNNTNEVQRSSSCTIRHSSNTVSLDNIVDEQEIIVKRHEDAEKKRQEALKRKEEEQAKLEEFYKQEAEKKYREMKKTNEDLEQPKSNGSICSNCGKENRLDAKFCKFCGNSMIQEIPIFCTDCGNKIKPGKKFCSACGKKIDN